MAVGNVRIREVRGSQMAAKVEGTFEAGGKEFPFEAIAFGRIGGQNVGAKLPPATEAGLRGLGLDPEQVAMDLQQSLLRGDLTIPDGVTKESFADG